MTETMTGMTMTEAIFAMIDIADAVYAAASANGFEAIEICDGCGDYLKHFTIIDSDHFSKYMVRFFIEGIGNDHQIMIQVRDNEDQLGYYSSPNFVFTGDNEEATYNFLTNTIA